ncbi:MAG: hypothetical protein H6907_06545 [Hyphomicrobiales bacterium]|nr:hypothetical protein [Hyphomicrobiales bacterium]
MSDAVTRGTKKGEAFERLLLSLVALSPSRPDRVRLIESRELAGAHESKKELANITESKRSTDSRKLTETEKRNAAKTLGRVVAADVFREVIMPEGNNERINLPELGLIAVTISLPVLNDDFGKWVMDEKKGPEPTQENVAHRIRRRTIKWIIDNADDDGLPLFLRDIWIVHGSNSFDMLILVMYRRSKLFMAYVREVVQRVRGVLRTQTMQVSNSLGNSLDLEKEYDMLIARRDQQS